MLPVYFFFLLLFRWFSWFSLTDGDLSPGGSTANAMKMLTTYCWAGRLVMAVLWGQWETHPINCHRFPTPQKDLRLSPPPPTPCCCKRKALDLHAILSLSTSRQSRKPIWKITNKVAINNACNASIDYPAGRPQAALPWVMRLLAPR